MDRWDDCFSQNYEYCANVPIYMDLTVSPMFTLLTATTTESEDTKKRPLSHHTFWLKPKCRFKAWIPKMTVDCWDTACCRLLYNKLINVFSWPEPVSNYIFNLNSCSKHFATLPWGDFPLSGILEKVQASSCITKQRLYKSHRLPSELLPFNFQWFVCAWGSF